ncbi:MAG TPA: sigma 54-interacting transcriptional regulator [Thermoanaerobaculia bacterium]|jgi:DNA-binding NtrC family response regulator|nr:sigma 54-interacting transcriptional regulator [Thermoanaerobaculia bacterium]
MKRSGRVLVIDDQPQVAEALARLAPDVDLIEVRHGADSRRFARSWSEAAPLLEGRRAPEAVVLDLRFDLPDQELLPDARPLGETAAGKRLRRERRERQGLFILERLRRRRPDLPVLLTTAYEDIAFEEEALRLKADAFTYATPEEETSGAGIVAALRRILAERDVPPRTGRFFWGSSLAMRELRRRVSALAPTPMPLLITGPTGTGKSLLVRDVIHPLSGRSGAFVPFDCATVPDGLLSSALFGALRGSFTGAIADRAGVFEAAADGTLFLDEVENLTGDAQKMLLTALHDGRIRRVGSATETPHTARVVAASNADLGRQVGQAQFRSDLLMRLNPSLALEIPRLAERREDMPELARATAGSFFADPRHGRAIAALVRAAGGPEPDGPIVLALSEPAASRSESSVVFVLPGKAWAAMERHPWPGNVRQFEMVIADSIAAAVYAGAGASLDRSGHALIPLDARMLFDLLAGARAGEAGGSERWVLDRPKSPSVALFRRDLERAALRALFQETGGDFERMAELMTGSRREARAVRLRFNKLGLSARGER